MPPKFTVQMKSRGQVGVVVVEEAATLHEHHDGEDGCASWKD